MYVIHDGCIACGACAGGCPAGAISMNDDLGRYEIDAGTCIECGSCEGTCPMGVISAE